MEGALCTSRTYEKCIKIRVGKSERKIPLWRPGVLGKLIINSS